MEGIKMDNVENFLAHIGVKKRSGRYPWGSGKRPFQSSGPPGGGGKSSSQNTEPSLSNEELRARNERQRLINESLRLQREFGSLTKKDKTAGQKFVEDILKDSGKKIIVGYMVSTANKRLYKNKEGKK